MANKTYTALSFSKFKYYNKDFQDFKYFFVERRKQPEVTVTRDYLYTIIKYHPKASFKLVKFMQDFVIKECHCGIYDNEVVLNSCIFVHYEEDENLVELRKHPRFKEVKEYNGKKYYVFKINRKTFEKFIEGNYKEMLTSNFLVNMKAVYRKVRPSKSYFVPFSVWSENENLVFKMNIWLNGRMVIDDEGEIIMEETEEKLEQLDTKVVLLKENLPTKELLIL